MDRAVIRQFRKDFPGQLLPQFNAPRADRFSFPIPNSVFPIHILVPHPAATA
jgi:hypothetical protein